MKHHLQSIKIMAANNICPQAQASLGSADAKRALSEALATAQKAIAQLNEARRVRPEQLNAPITL